MAANDLATKGARPRQPCHWPISPGIFQSQDKDCWFCCISVYTQVCFCIQLCKPLLKSTTKIVYIIDIQIRIHIHIYIYAVRNRTHLMSMLSTWSLPHHTVVALWNLSHWAGLKQTTRRSHPCTTQPLPVLPLGISIHPPGLLQYMLSLPLKIKSREISFALNYRSLRLIVLKFCTEHGSDTAVPYAKFRSDLVTEICERDFARFELKVCFGGLSYITTISSI